MIDIILSNNGNPDSIIPGLYSPVKFSTSKNTGHEKNIIAINIVRSIAPGFGLKKWNQLRKPNMIKAL